MEHKLFDRKNIVSPAHFILVTYTHSHYVFSCFFFCFCFCFFFVVCLFLVFFFGGGGGVSFSGESEGVFRMILECHILSGIGGAVRSNLCFHHIVSNCFVFITH